LHEAQYLNYPQAQKHELAIRVSFWAANPETVTAEAACL
jgi:hypothetical protein